MPRLTFSLFWQRMLFLGRKIIWNSFRKGPLFSSSLQTRHIFVHISSALWKQTIVTIPEQVFFTALFLCAFSKTMKSQEHLLQCIALGKIQSCAQKVSKIAPTDIRPLAMIGMFNRAFISCCIVISKFNGNCTLC